MIRGQVIIRSSIGQVIFLLIYILVTGQVNLMSELANSLSIS
ncbi:hypothetical protein C5167_018407 [Papaver somniferum]|uniref:Uncharacterized protein n=1 Tax=Papaver somniferum TaxID=3469 RepID=A0A4Y7IM57_PAPSO|nr:hypothetical protein C5167_018407 [Papaver somniferum]